MNSDFLLIRRMKQGDESSFDTFVRKYYKDILVYCSYHCSDREYAEDLTQETFVRFLLNCLIITIQGKRKIICIRLLVIYVRIISKK